MKALEVCIAGYRMANLKTSLGGYARQIKLLHCGGTTSFVLPFKSTIIFKPGACRPEANYTHLVSYN